MATNRTTTTVAVRLDLAELIGQLRNLADTLEATQRPRLTVKAEDAECKHEAWDVHPNGITRRCSDCRAPLPDLEPGTCHCGAKPNEVHNPLFAHPERVTVSEVYINPNPNGFTPEAVEAPEQRCAPSKAELSTVLIGCLGRDDYLSDTVFDERPVSPYESGADR